MESVISEIDVDVIRLKKILLQREKKDDLKVTISIKEEEDDPFQPFFWLISICLFFLKNFTLTF